MGTPPRLKDGPRGPGAPAPGRERAAPSRVAVRGIQSLEAGAVGQVPGPAAREAGGRAGGLGAEPGRGLTGLSPVRRGLDHFTVGGPTEDPPPASSPAHDPGAAA